MKSLNNKKLLFLELSEMNAKKIDKFREIKKLIIKCMQKTKIWIKKIWNTTNYQIDLAQNGIPFGAKSVEKV